MLKPESTAGRREWISQIGLHGVQPSIRVSTTELIRDDGSGYVVVVVPPSPRAPHMADGRYYWRSDTTNSPMTDAQARQFWRRNLDRRDDALSLLRQEVDREPAPTGVRSAARLFVFAQPLSADPRLLLDAVPDRDLLQWVHDLSSSLLINKQRVYNPGIHDTTEVGKRARGAARSTCWVGFDRVVRHDYAFEDTSGLVDLEIHEDGGIRYYFGRGSVGAAAEKNLLVEAIVGEVSACVQLARVVSHVAGFGGSWSFGVALRGLRSAPAYRLPSAISHLNVWRYSEDHYDEVGEADHTELNEPESPVLENLTGRFCRSLLHHGSTARKFDVFPVTITD